MSLTATLLNREIPKFPDGLTITRYPLDSNINRSPVEVAQPDKTDKPANIQQYENMLRNIEAVFDAIKDGCQSSREIITRTKLSRTCVFYLIGRLESDERVWVDRARKPFMFYAEFGDASS